MSEIDTKIINFLKRDDDLYQMVRMCELLDEENNDIDYITGDSKEELLFSMFNNLKRIFCIFFPDFIFEGCDEDGELFREETQFTLETWVSKSENKDQHFYYKFFLLETYFNKYFNRIDAKLSEKFGYKVTSKTYDNINTNLYFLFRIEDL